VTKILREVVIVRKLVVTHTLLRNSQPFVQTAVSLNTKYFIVQLMHSII